MGTEIIFIFGIGIIYLLGVILSFRAISYQCVMGMFGIYSFSLRNFLIALSFPISIPIMLIKSFIEERKFNKNPKEEFEKFKKKRLKEYENIFIPYKKCPTKKK